MSDTWVRQTQTVGALWVSPPLKISLQHSGFRIAGVFKGKKKYMSQMRAVLVAQLCTTLFCDPMDIAHHVPLSLGLSSQEYFSGLPSPSPTCQSTQGLSPGLLHSGEFLTFWPPETYKRASGSRIVQRSRLGSPTVLLPSHSAG